MNAALVWVLLPTALLATFCLDYWLPLPWFMYWVGALSLWLPQKLWYYYQLDRQQTSTAIRSHWIWRIVIASPVSPAYLLCVLIISFQLCSWFYLLALGRPFFNDGFPSLRRRNCLEYYGIYAIHTRSVTLLPPDVTYDTNMTSEDPTDIKHLGVYKYTTRILANNELFDSPYRNFVLLPWVPVMERCVTCNDSGEYECNYKNDTCSVKRFAAMYFSGKRGKVLSTQDPETYYCTALAPNKKLPLTSEGSINELYSRRPSEGILRGPERPFVSVSRRSFNNCTRIIRLINHTLSHTLSITGSLDQWEFGESQQYSYFCVEPSRQILANIGACKFGHWAMRDETVILERIHPLFRFLILETDFMAYFNIDIQTAIRYMCVLIIFSLGWPITAPIIFLTSLWLLIRGLLLTLIGYPPETMFYYEYIEDPYLDPSDHAWLVAACHRLNPYLEDVMDARIITVDQYDRVHKLQLEKGAIYGLRLLQHCIIENQTIELLRRFVQTSDLNLPDGYQSATSSDTSSDVEQEDPFQCMTVISLFYANESQPGHAWLVAACHRLNPYLEDVMDARIITVDQYDRVHKLQLEKGKIYGLRLLRHCIIENQTIELLRRFVQTLDLALPDGDQSATSSDTSSDVEQEDTLHYLTFISLFYAKEDQPCLEDLLPYILSDHQLVRIVDTRVARGDLHAARLLVYIIRRKNRVDCFIEWYCSQLQIPEYQRSGITRAIEHSN